MGVPRSRNDVIPSEAGIWFLFGLAMDFWETPRSLLRSG